jgi:hypothetical protein
LHKPVSLQNTYPICNIDPLFKKKKKKAYLKKDAEVHPINLSTPEAEIRRITV